MSTRRVLGFTISLLQLIIIVALFLPFASNVNAFTALKPISFVMIGFSAIGLILGIIGAKVELNYISVGVILTELITTIVASLMEGSQVTLNFGFFAIAVLTLFVLIGTFIYGFMVKGVSPKKQKVTVVNGQQKQNGTQRTNSLNMNMPVNNYQALPVTRVEKQKAPMDILLAGKDNPVPLGSTVIQGNNTVQSHMAELGLQSINISADNLTGEQPQPFAQQPVPPAPQAQQPAIQSPFGPPQPLNQVQPAMPEVQPIPPAQPGAPMPQPIPNAGGQAPMPQPAMQKPDLLAGSSMSGQLDTSPYNAQPVQPGQGQFF